MEPFKTFLSEGEARRIAVRLDRQVPGAGPAFLAAVVPRLESLELMARARTMAAALHWTLPEAHDDRAMTLRAMLSDDGDGAPLSGWVVLPITLVVGDYWDGDFVAGLDLLGDCTGKFSSEFAIRPFLLKDQARTLDHLARWTDHPDLHRRRLVSEGTRPRLPWGVRLPALIRDPAPLLPLLERLRDDPEEYVRRSVANSMNDIAKDHPALVTDLARRWMQDAPAPRRALIAHALRSLIKKGDAAALAVLGRGRPEVSVSPLRLASRRVAMGGALEFEATIASTGRAAQELTVDYVLHLLKANGTQRPKVFKGSVLRLGAGEAKVFRRAHRFREVTTRVHYPGEHAVSLRINGVDTEPVPFVLEG